jgi:cytochrome d ubiquinol oxidase subunit II
MGPVWEANHVWLIFVLTGLLTTFPAAFAALGSALLVPATLALLGLVVRGAALAFSAQLTATDRAHRPLQMAFGVASAAAPLILGAIAGGLARQRLVVERGAVRAGGGLALWVGPFQLAVGLLAVATCTALAASFLTVDTGRAGDVALARAFRRLAVRATATTAGLAFIALALAAALAPPLFRGLTGRGLPAVAAGLVALVVALEALRRRRDRLARAALAIATAALVWGWGLAQFPRLVGTQITVANAAAPAAELHAIAIALAAGAAVLLPALWLLYGAFRRHLTQVTR